VVIFAVLSLICFVLFLYPYIFYPFVLRLWPARPVRFDPSAPPPSASAMFAAYNEERSLPAKIDNLRAIHHAHPEIELLAYSDASTDGTLAMLEAQRDMLTVIGAAGRHGKATGMRMMVAAAHGEICIFTDANVILDPASIGPLLAYFSDPEVGGVAGALCYVNEEESPTARVGGTYWRLEETVKRLESRCGSIIGADGSIFAVRRALYRDVPPHLLDDMTVSTYIILAGKRMIHAADVVAYEKTATSSADEFRRKRRIACRAFNTHRYVWPKILRHYSATNIFKYVSHKLLRWLGLVPLALAILFGLVAATLAGHVWAVLIAAAAIGIGYALGRAGVPLLAVMSEAILLITATFCGICDSLRGKTYQTWEPAASRN
jgi:cellulose synthase/poly-beta-1,6-N-acetylglucosamine synthase-like glycosyltransferase